MTGNSRVNVSRISSWQTWAVMVSGGASVFLGLLVLTGWYTHNTLLIQVHSAFVPMQYNTALGFLLCGVGLVGVALRRTGFAVVAGAGVGALGLLTLIEYIFGLNLGIDQLLMEHYVTVETSHPGRMAPNTALCFLLIAVALMLEGLFQSIRKHPVFVGVLGALTFSLGVVAFIGYLSGASTAYGWGHLTRMAVHTAAGFLVLGIGILAVAYRENALTRAGFFDTSKTPRRRVFVVSTVIMTVVTLTVALNVVRELHHAVIENRKVEMLALVTSWAETMAASGRLDITAGRLDEGSRAEAEALRQVTVAFERLSEHSGDSEFVLARRDGDRIDFLLAHNHRLDRDHPKFVAFDSGWAEPMRLALLGGTGTVIALDYGGDLVLAAYTPFGPYHWGLVGKVDMTEVEAPFVTATLLACGVGFAIIVLGALAFLMVVDPMIQALAERTVELDREVVEHKRAEEELKKYRRHLEELVEDRTRELRVANQDLEDFAYSVSHDLKAPLRAITGFSEIISRRHRDCLNEESRRYFDHILAAGVNMNRLIEDLLRFSRLGRQAVEAQPVPLADVFTALETTFRDRVQELGGSLNIPEDLPTVRGDRTLLDQVFVNLVDNALSYRRPEMAPRVEISWRSKEARVIVSVKDNGIGIPAEFHEKVFKIFRRLHNDAEKPGTGIGLALVKRAVAMLNGEVLLQSATPEGSIFHVDLLLSKEEPEHGQISPDPIG